MICGCWQPSVGIATRNLDSARGILESPDGRFSPFVRIDAAPSEHRDDLIVPCGLLQPPFGSGAVGHVSEGSGGKVRTPRIRFALRSESVRWPSAPMRGRPSYGPKILHRRMICSASRSPIRSPLNVM